MLKSAIGQNAYGCPRTFFIWEQNQLRVIFLPTNTALFYLGLDPSNFAELESGDGSDETLSEVTDAADVLVEVLFDAPDVDDDENDVFCCGCCVV